MQPFDMYFPDSFEEAGELVVEHGAKPISGGTALTALMKERIFRPTALVNLRRLADEHDYIQRRDGALHFGALTTLRSIETSDVVLEHLPVVADCASKIASVRIRNVATIGGHLAHADPDLDLPPVLAGLDAEIVVTGPDGERAEPITEFVRGYYDTHLEPGELVSGVRIPIKPERSGVYLKHRSLSEADWPCVGVAAFLDDGTDVPAVFMNSVADTPIMRVEGLDDVFADGITEDAIDRAGELASEQCDPIGDARGSAWYKRRMAGEFTIRALRSVTGVGEPLATAAGEL